MNLVTHLYCLPLEYFSFKGKGKGGESDGEEDHVSYEIMTIEEDDMHEVMLRFQVFTIGRTS